MAKYNQRVIGLIGVVSRMANWNADFTGLPKTTSDGDIFGSDKALKYSIKRLWAEQEKKVLYIRSYKIGKGKDVDQEKEGKKKGKEGKEGEKMQPRELKERYEYLFNEEVSKDSATVLKRLFDCIDVINFGATFAIEGQNLGLTGVVQVGQGFNKYPNTNIQVQDILSPFRNSNEKSEDKDATSIGKKTTVNEAHYIYPFTVNPKHYDGYIGLTGMDGFEGYTVEAYEAFKEGALIGATALNTNSKAGCENAFSLFIEFKEHAQTYLPNLDPYVRVYKEQAKAGGLSKTIYDLTAITPIIESVQDQIEKIELYVNSYAAEVRLQVPGLVSYNIISRTAL
ncbi:type I CRISPR-associated protein Cas7 [Paenibacillus sp. SYP-B3998]|uniref:Type I CRISPR-associated protein Cas7 n=1 Tax=Paenibacillus sp. SYP-B3998 TaxID=2678564 RepID=A0A6G4A1P8_9BACL|nr:type I CRISPR-associated protein Cas7 [Paenibacillus sp. SYP-B3998]NEW07864.1 type I CRISPR-associated protein Cas7 [Paenibacillus sp. SYP-B3998]